MSVQDKEELVSAKGAVSVGEAEPAVQLGVVPETQTKVGVAFIDRDANEGVVVVGADLEDVPGGRSGW